MSHPTLRQMFQLRENLRGLQKYPPGVTCHFECGEKPLCMSVLSWHVNLWGQVAQGKGLSWYDVVCNERDSSSHLDFVKCMDRLSVRLWHLRRHHCGSWDHFMAVALKTETVGVLIMWQLMAAGHAHRKHSSDSSLYWSWNYFLSQRAIQNMMFGLIRIFW